MTRPPRRNKKKKKPPAKHPQPVVSSSVLPPILDTVHTASTQRNSQLPPQLMMPEQEHYISTDDDLFSLGVKSDNYIRADDQEMQHHFYHNGGHTPSTQDMFTICDNSSAYESSEDTGVGGLSDPELIGVPDGIGVFHFTLTLSSNPLH